MQDGPTKELDIEQNKIDEISNLLNDSQIIAEDGKKYQIVAQDDVDETQLIKQSDNKYKLLINRKTIWTMAGLAAPVGGTIGHHLGHAAGIEAGTKVGQAVEKELNEYGQTFATKILKSVGLDNIPGAKFFVNAEISQLAHEGGEIARNQTIDVATKQGTACGSALAMGATVVTLEAINVIGWVYNAYVQPKIDAYREARAKQRALEADAKEAERQQIASALDEGWVEIPNDTIEEDAQNTVNAVEAEKPKFSL